MKILGTIVTDDMKISGPQVTDDIQIPRAEVTDEHQQNKQTLQQQNSAQITEVSSVKNINKHTLPNRVIVRKPGGSLKPPPPFDPKIYEWHQDEGIKKCIIEK